VLIRLLDSATEFIDRQALTPILSPSKTLTLQIAPFIIDLASTVFASERHFATALSFRI